MNFIGLVVELKSNVFLLEEYRNDTYILVLTSKFYVNFLGFRLVSKVFGMFIKSWNIMMGT